MKTLSSFILLALCSVLLVAEAADAREMYAPQAQSEGELQGLDFGANRALINGYQYDFSSTAKVEIGGTYGAFTMLKEGMLVKFTYLQFSDGVREITSMKEVNQIERI